MTQIVLSIAVYALPAILAITLHEAAHGYAAKLLGDNTAWMLGRVSLNPVRHIDPVGTILIPALLLVGTLVSGTSGMLFGWAKPVPVNFGRLRNPKRDMVWVALAGPGCNLLQALCWALFLKLMPWEMVSGVLQSFLYEVCIAGISVNLMLMAFNLIPVPPLDGGRVVTGLLPYRLAVRYAVLEPYGMIAVLVLIASGLLNFFIRPFLAVGTWLVNLVL